MGSDMANNHLQRRSIYLWSDKSLCIGPSNTLLSRQYGAAAIHVGLYSPFKIAINDKVTLETRCAYVPVNVKHRLIAAGAVQGKLFIERNSPAYEHILQLVTPQSRCITGFDHPRLVELMQWVHEDSPSKAYIDGAFDCYFKFTHKARSQLDQRIQQVMTLTQAEVEESYPVDQLASSVFLSASHFLHLFKDSADMPYRRYRRWQRLQKAMSTYYHTDSITTAAMESGFTDVSHFSNSFKQTYGVQPSQVFKKVSTFEVN